MRSLFTIGIVLASVREGSILPICEHHCKLLSLDFQHVRAIDPHLLPKPQFLYPIPARRFLGFDRAPCIPNPSQMSSQTTNSRQWSLRVAAHGGLRQLFTERNMSVTKQNSNVHILNVSNFTQKLTHAPNESTSCFTYTTAQVDTKDPQPGAPPPSKHPILG